MRQIIFYRTQNGHAPVVNYLDSLTGKEAQKVLWVLKLIEEKEAVPKKFLKKLDGTSGLYEVRVQFGNNIFRLLGFFDGENIIILTSGFTKKSQKIPIKEIKTAENRKQDYLNRRNR